MSGNMIMQLKVGGSDLKFKVPSNSYGFSNGASSMDVGWNFISMGIALQNIN